MFGQPGLLNFPLKKYAGCTVRYECPLTSTAPITLRHFRAENRYKQRWSIMKYRVLEHHKKVVRRFIWAIELLRLKFASVFLTNPVDILCNYGKSQTILLMHQHAKLTLDSWRNSFPYPIHQIRPIIYHIACQTTSTL